MNGDDNRRELPRFLCSDAFSNSIVNVGSERYDLISLNFNRGGIALFSQTALPEVKQAQVSFSLQAGENRLEVEDLACELSYCHDSDVGFQYGLCFPASNREDDTVAATLLKMESYLAAHTDKEDRYGLFS